jgi:hypothetical protein
MSLFRWKKGEHENWIKKINRFNRKVEQAKKSGYSAELPDKISYTQTLKSILSNKDYTRREFNNQMKMIDIFLEKDSLEVVKSKRGANAPKWQLEQIKKVILPDINKTHFEVKKIGEEKSGFKEKADLNPNETRKRKLNFENKSQKDFEMFVQTFSDYNNPTETIIKRTKEGYYKAVENEMGGENNPHALAIKGLLDQLPDDVIMANAIYNPNTEFRFVYSKDDEIIRYKKIKNAWTKIYKDYMKSLE